MQRDDNSAPPFEDEEAASFQFLLTPAPIAEVESLTYSHEVSPSSSGGMNANANNNNPEPQGAGNAGPVQSDSRVFRDVRTYKKISQNPVEKLKYLLKPAGFIAAGTGLTCFGIALTVSHFMYEDSLNDDVKSKPYFTYGPIAFASGLMILMIGVVWFAQKHHKWSTGLAAPIASAAVAAVALVTSATMSSDHFRNIPGSGAVGGAPSQGISNA